MPSKIIPYLGYTAAALVAAYLMLVAVTVSMAAWKTSLSIEVHETEQDIARLESRFYAMVADIDRADPGSRGLEKPRSVTYATTQAAPTVSIR